ncbi:MAG: SlyX family protein [Pirellulaceae bacterium]
MTSPDSHEPHPGEDLPARVERLEMLLTHVDSLVAELNRVVVDQARTIDRLEHRYQRLAQRQIQMEESVKPQDRLPEDERPPHY